MPAWSVFGHGASGSLFNKSPRVSEQDSLGVLALTGIIFFLASCVVLCFGVVMKILVTQQ